MRGSEDHSPFSGWESGFMDIDNDGWKDLLIAAGT